MGTPAFITYCEIALIIFKSLLISHTLPSVSSQNRTVGRYVSEAHEILEINKKVSQYLLTLCMAEKRAKTQ